ncbi:uncharacterized protein LOC143040305 isoform X3 [Oratosquilla oratoria]|uniref:uncharacterized protein LOC143040305 isoform X3 n=1 Tax=Oratosquilla oratoria TaxID=337810 RepID=UPI003F75E08C
MKQYSHFMMNPILSIQPQEQIPMDNMCHPLSFMKNLNDELNLEHPASEVNSNEQDVPPFEPQEILNGSSCCFPAKKKKQSAVIHRQRMQIRRLLKKIEKIKVSKENHKQYTPPSAIIKKRFKLPQRTSTRLFSNPIEVIRSFKIWQEIFTNTTMPSTRTVLQKC